MDPVPSASAWPGSPLENQPGDHAFDDSVHELPHKSRFRCPTGREQAGVRSPTKLRHCVISFEIVSIGRYVRDSDGRTIAGLRADGQHGRQLADKKESRTAAHMLSGVETPDL